MAYFKYNSNRIFYREAGAGDLLIIIPGNTAASVMHSNELEYFSKNYHVVSLDILGTGQSDRLEKWDVNWWKEGAHQVNALIEHLGYEKSILIGSSGGAVIALLCAIEHKEKIKGVIADSFSEVFTKEMLENNVIKERNYNDVQKTKFWKFSHGEDWQSVVTKDTDTMKALVNKGGEWLENRVHDIECPVLLTASMKDNMINPIEYGLCELSNKLNKCKLFINDEGAHPLIWSESKIFRDISELFLKQLKSE